MENFCLWNPESVEVLLVNSGILGFGIPNAAQGIQNPSFTDKDWNPVPGILNPCQGIQNPRLSWITSQGDSKHCGPKVPFFFQFSYIGNLKRVEIMKV